MSFFEDAQWVFETAEQGSGAADLGILVDDSGALRIVEAAGWRPEALQAHYGARTVFQVTRDAVGVRVAARSGSRACTLSVGQEILFSVQASGSSPELLRRSAASAENEIFCATASVLRSFDHLGRARHLLDLPRHALL